MSINTDIWGTDYQNPWHYCAKMTRNSMWEYVTGGVLTLNELPDPSGCYCAMDTLNPYINAFVIKPDKSTVPIFKKTDIIHNWFFMQNEADPAGDPYNMEFRDPTGDLYNKWSKWANTSQLQYFYAEYSNKFLFNLKLNKLLFVPMIGAGAEGTYSESEQTFTLADYVESGHVDYPYIHSVYMDIYYNISETNTPTWIVARGSDRYYEFFAFINELSDDFRALRSNLNNVYSTFCLFTTPGTGESHTRYYIPIQGFGYQSQRELVRYPISFDPDMSHYVYNTVNNPTHVRYSVLYTSEYIEYLYRSIAYFGVFYLAEGSGNFNHVNLYSNRVYCGTIESDSVTRGNYTKGLYNLLQPQFNWTDTSESEYDPYNPPEVDPNTYDGSMHTGDLLFFTNPTTRYNISYNNFVNLCNKLWDALALLPAGDPLPDYCLDTFLTTDPIDSIVSVKYFPISEDMGDLSTTVHLGKYDTLIPASIAKNAIRKDCGEIKIYPRFGEGKTNWLDALTTIILYLPFCGTVELNAAEYMDRTINVEYLIDLSTGNCSAVVSYIADNGKKVISDIASGVCSIDLPVTGIQHMTLDSQLYNATEQLKSMRINNAVKGLNSILGLTSAPDKGLTGGIAQLTASGASIYNALHSETVAEYNLQHTQLPIKMIGTTGACTGAMCELYPTLIIARPDISGINNSAYAHVNGYACCRSSTIGSFTGYTQFANADLSGFAATASEKDMILTALKSGVIL